MSRYSVSHKVSGGLSLDTFVEMIERPFKNVEGQTRLTFRPIHLNIMREGFRGVCVHTWADTIGGEIVTDRKTLREELAQHIHFAVFPLSADKPVEGDYITADAVLRFLKERQLLKSEEND